VEDEEDRLEERAERLEQLLQTVESRLKLAKRERTRAALEPLLEDVQKHYAKVIDALWKR
jgi:hypothetical protein